MAISRHPEPCADPRPSLTGELDSRRTLRSMSSSAVSPAGAYSELGPRSLDPVRSFGSAFAELIWDQPSLTDFCNCIRRAGNQTRALRFSQGRRPRPPSFSDASRCLPCGSGDARRAALRPSKPTPVKVTPGSPGLPDRDADSYAPPPEACACGCVVRIDVHGSKDRVKDASSEHTYDLSCVCRVHALCGACRRRSPPRRPSDIRCHRRDCTPGGYPRHSPDRPRPPF
jgi:hypothetical protein